MSLLQILPPTWHNNAKTYVVTIGVLLSALVVSIDNLPNWILILTKIVTILGVHFQPEADLNNNGIPDKDE